MQLASIEIQNNKGARIGVLSGNIGIRCGSGLALSGAGNRVYLSSRPVVNIFEQAYLSMLDTPYITSINSITATADGNFFIHGSGCTDVENAAGGDFPEHVEHGIVIVDRCPSCKSCDTDIRVKKMIEYYAMWFSALKDAQLEYTKTVAAKLELWKEQKITTPSACSATLLGMDEKYLSDIEMPGIKLLFQYATMVHLWNYAVMTNNSSTQIVVAPEDNAGFVVQTRRSVPSCDGKVGVACNVHVTRLSGQSDLSLYIHTPSVEFKPFDNEYITQDMASVVNETSAAHMLDKQVNAAFGYSKIAGVYMLTVKVLPFIAVILRTKDGKAINSYNNIWKDPAASTAQDVTEMTGTGYNLNDSGGTAAKTSYCTTEIAEILNPKLSDYNNGKLYPSASTNTLNLWQVDVTWKLQVTGEAEPREFAETYYYSGNGVRVPVENILMEEEYGSRLIALIRERKASLAEV